MSFVAGMILAAASACDGGGTDDPVDTERADDAIQLNIELSGSLQNPAFIRDGSSIVFTRFRDGYNSGAADLYIYDLDSGVLRSLISNNSSNVNLPGSSWDSVTGSIVFSSDREPHDEIFQISDTGTTGEESQLTNRQDRQSFEPTFSPNGQWIVFESHAIDVENDGVITKYKVDGSSAYIELTAAEDDSRQPNWSPAGNKILYQRNLNDNWAIWSMDADGANPEIITNPNESSTDAAFSQNGQWIVYSSENDDVDLANIYRIAVEGGESTRITSYSGYDGAPSVSPDGTRVAFESTAGDPDISAGASLWIIDISN